MQILNKEQLYDILRIWQNSFPLIIMSSSVLLVQASNLFFLSQKQDNSLIVGYGMANTLWNAAFLAPIISLSEGYYTQVSQAKGSNSFRIIGKYTQKQLVIVFSYFFVYLLWLYFASDIFILIGLQPRAAFYARQYLILTIPVNFLRIVWYTIRAYMMAFQEYQVPSILQNFSSILHIILLYISCVIFKLDISGICLTYFLLDSFIILCGFKFIFSKPELLKGYIQFELKNLKQLIDYMKITIQYGLVNYVETCFFEIICVLISLTQDEQSLAAHVALANTLYFFYMVPKGIGDYANQQVAETLGSGQVQKTQYLTKTFILSITGIVILYSIFAVCVKSYLVQMFTSETEMRLIYSQIYDIYIYLYFLADSYIYVLGCIIKSLGLQTFALQIFILFYYILGIPFIYLLIQIFQLGVQGAWIGCALISIAASYALFRKIQMVDYQKQYQILKYNIELQHSSLIQLEKQDEILEKSLI